MKAITQPLGRALPRHRRETCQRIVRDVACSIVTAAATIALHAAIGVRWLIVRLCDLADERAARHHTRRSPVDLAEVTSALQSMHDTRQR